MAKYERGFQGNVNVRPAGVPINWTQEQLIEYARCAQDPLYFITNYVKIKHVDFEELVPFVPRPYQEEMLEKMLSERKVIVKLPRQAGKTTIVAAVLLWHAIFNLNYGILIAANKGDKARDVVRAIKDMFEGLPEFLQPGVKEYNKGTVIFENGSRFKASATSSSAGRGDTWNCIYVDEAAFLLPHIANEFFESVVPTISSGKTTKIFMTSTPKGLNHFYKMWTAAVAGTSGYVYVEIKWNDVPGRDEEFKRQIVAEFGDNYFAQEYAAEFLGSSRTLISAAKLQSLASTPPIKQSGSTRVYSDPTPGHSYAITVDVSEGLGEDFTVAMVFDITSLPYTIAAVYHDNTIEPMALPGVVHDLARAYNDALVLIEANFGQQVGEILYNELEYENLVFTTKGKTGPQAKMDKISGGFNPRSRVGLVMSAQSKRIGCSNLKTLVESDQLLINDAELIDELLRFSVKKNSYAAESGHDDLVMCLVMFAWMADQGYIRDATDVNLRGKLAELNAKRLEDEMLPLGFRLEGDEEEHVYFEVAKRPAIELPGENGEDNKYADMFDRSTTRGGKSETELHDDFIRQMFSS